MTLLPAKNLELRSPSAALFPNRALSLRLDLIGCWQFAARNAAILIGPLSELAGLSDEARFLAPRRIDGR
ncbi:hypothetical protein ACPP3B_13660 [Tepidimonas sp. HKU77]|uniref:hypothetical protein n=1 Tax=Tepidimonas sp. HKU77 TaxID=3414503 RepID=UPI003C7CCA30